MRRVTGGERDVGPRKATGPTFASPKGKRRVYEPNEIVFKVDPEALREGLSVDDVTTRGGARAMAFSAAAAKRVPEAISAPLDDLAANAGLTDVEPLVQEPTAARAQSLGKLAAPARARLAAASSVVEVVDAPELAGVSVGRLDKPVTAAQLKRLAAAPGIEYAERLPSRWLLAAGVDPMRNLQWALPAVRWYQAKLPSVSGVSVGVIDTGIDAEHPDLLGTVASYDHSGVRATDLLGHGTHVAGTIAARTNNEVGIAGLAQTALQIWKVFPDEPAADGEFYVDARAYPRALLAASRAGIAVLNLSLGGTAQSRADRDLFDRLEASGVVVVAAMGNAYQDGNEPNYPAAYDGVIAVGAVAVTGQRAPFSNTGTHISLVAPGVNVLSTLPRRKSKYRGESGYVAWDGTSMAAPHVAAAAALLRAKNPGWSTGQVKAHLETTAAPLPGMNGRRTQALGSGLVDFEAALK